MNIDVDVMQDSRWTILPEGEDLYTWVPERHLQPTLMDAIRAAPKIRNAHSRIVQTIGGKVIGQIDGDKVLLAMARRCALAVAWHWAGPELQPVLRYLIAGRQDDVMDVRQAARKLVYSWRSFRKPKFRAAVRALFISTRSDIPVLAAKYAAKYAMAADYREAQDVKNLQEAAMELLLFDARDNDSADSQNGDAHWVFNEDPDTFAGYNPAMGSPASYGE